MAVGGEIYADGDASPSMGQHVLVAVDGSLQSEKAFEYVLEELSDPSITLINVIDQANAFAYADADDMGMDIEGYLREEQRRREGAEKRLESYRERARERGVEADVIVTRGKPAKQILKAAADRDVDHIAMGSHGRSGVGRVVFGSVAETVTRRSPVPVTIVH